MLLLYHDAFCTGDREVAGDILKRVGVAADEGKDIVTGDVQARRPHHNLGRVSGFGVAVACHPSPAEHISAESAAVRREWAIRAGLMGRQGCGKMIGGWQRRVGTHA